MSPAGLTICVGVSVAAILVFVFVRLRPRRIVENILSSKTAANPGALENPKYGTVSDTREGLRITYPKGASVELRWSEIEEVHAFKRDLITTDLICLVFKKSGKDEYHEINEEMAGYHDLIQSLPKYLPKFNLEWMVSVMFPAFETNHEVIWRR